MPAGSGASGPKRFLLGVGCQKGGTTWLYDYLSGSPQFVPGFTKEFHVFSVADFPEDDFMRNRVVQLAQQALTNYAEGNGGRAHHLQRLAMVLDQDVYYDYFAMLLRRSDAVLSADVTPDYSRLSASRLRGIRSAFAERGVAARACFVLRDPVERTWSQLRMRRQRHPEWQVAQIDEEEALLRMVSTDVYDRRSRYGETISALDDAFPEDEVFYAFYEELFSESEVARLCEMVGIEAHPPRLDVRANASERSARLGPETERALTRHYAEVYAAVAERFGRDRVVALWPRAALVV